MTAIVGILNKQAVAVAADSAVTVGGGVKIYNTANKIFNLAKGCPVGIAIYGNASLNGCVPWEVVIKMYRKHIGSNKFPLLSDYVRDFIDYIKEFSQKYISNEDALLVLKRSLLQFWNEVITRGLRESDELDSPIAETAFATLKKKLDIRVRSLRKQKTLTEYKDLNKEDYFEVIRDILDIIKGQITTNGGKWEDEYEVIVKECMYRLVITNNPFSQSSVSGVAIFGYGENEIYPTLLEQQIYNRVLDIQRIESKPNLNSISESNGVSICPMAQSDVIETFIEGVSNKIKNTFIEATASVIRATVKSVSNIIRTRDSELANSIDAIDCSGIINSYNNQINSIINRDQVSPLIHTVASMGKEDIADLAENLIYMTSMKRHVSPIAETVGGPIDVAIISKGDGFIWAKRKHYFSADLNRDFFDNRYNNH